MDGIQEEPTFLAHDWHVFGYEDQDATVLGKSPEPEDEILQEDVFSSSADWKEWFSSPSSATVTNAQNAGLRMLLCSRAPEVFKGTPSPPSYLPFEEDIWERIANFWHVHRGITRVISRRAAFFSGIQNETAKQPEIYYFARMSTGAPDDLALSVTFLPKTRSVFAVVYGCNHQQTKSIRSRIAATTDTEAQHPLLSVGIFVEVERERLIDAANSLVDRFTLRSEILSNRYWSADMHGAGPKARENVALCLKSRTLVDQMRSVKRQLEKLITYVDKLDDWVTPDESGDDEYRRQLKKTGERLKVRIRDILDEYDEKINECKMMDRSLSLVMQTLWSQIAQKDSKTSTQIAQINTSIALETKSESVQMRSIALLTMIFVPLSCVASIFSTSLFNFPTSGSIVSKYIWIFIVVASVVTFGTVLIWYFATNYEKRKEKRCDSFKLREDSNMV